MKIVLISGEQYPFFIETANILHKKGYELHVFCFRDLRQSNHFTKLNNDITFYRDLVSKIDIDNNISFKLKIFYYVIKLKKRLTEIKPDILHAFNLKWGGWISAMSGYHPFILSGLGSDILKEQNAEKNYVLKKLRSFTINKADFITVISKQMEKQIKEIKKEQNTIFFAPGANSEKFSIGKPKKETVKKFIKFKNIIFSPRALKPLYQTIEIVKAFAILQIKYPTALLIIGGNTKSNYARKVKKIIEEKGLKDNTFFTERATHEEWLEYYRVSDIVVSYPFNDGMPATIFEAMAIKKPLILSDVPSIKQIVSHGENAHICYLNNYKILADGFNKLCNDKDYRDHLAKEAFKTFNEKGNSLKLIDNLENAYKNLLKG